MNKINESFSQLIKNVWFGIKTSFLASKLYFSLKVIVLFSTTIIPLISIWLWKEVLNGIIDHSNYQNKIIIYLFIYLFLQLITYIISQFNEYINSRYSDELQFYIEMIMMDKTSKVDLSFFDSAKMGDKVRHARKNFGVMTQTTWLVFDIISSFINIISTFIIICMYKWWIGIVTLALLVPFMVYNKKITEKKLEMEKEQIRSNRKKDYYRDIFFNNNIQFEIKLNNLGTYFIDKYKSEWMNLYLINMKEEVKHKIINSIIIGFNVFSELLVLIISSLDVINQKIAIGSMQYNISMASRLRSQAKTLMNNINTFLNNNERLLELQEFININPEIEKSGSRKPSSNPKIQFYNVSFKYPNTKEYVLKNCSFTIEPKEKIGLIGLNGSGKSTIIKLLFRFYDPEIGSIKLDGIDIKEYDIYAVRRIFGVLFQDYVTYCLPLREIISLSDFESRFDEEKLKKASDISGLSEIIKTWEDGYDSVLGRHYANNGKSLSGGQWQVLGLARAYFRDCDYMILDEPSAALDPISEDKIFKQLYVLSTGKSSITISHRLSNTTLADKILLIDNGTVIEQGPHSELLRQNGKYAKLFNLQASRYK